MASQTVVAAHTLPPLPYSYDALEPHIDARTMEIHHTKHHGTYVNNLNAAIEKAPEISGRSLDELLLGISRVPEAVRTAVRNNGGGHWNHTLFWQLMASGAGGEPSGGLADAIRRGFGDFAKSKEQFGAAAAPTRNRSSSTGRPAVTPARSRRRTERCGRPARTSSLGHRIRSPEPLQRHR
jgi:superoxide dismutase